MRWLLNEEFNMDMMKKWVLTLAALLMILTIGIAFILHFYKIDTIPYGYHVDELSGAVTEECLATEGIDAHNNRYPLFGQLNYGTPKPATYMYPAMLWGKIFGFSVPSLRSFSVVGHLVGIVGLFFLGRLLFGSIFGLWVVFAAVVSPWVWASSRVAFEPLLAPTFFIWGLYFFFRRQTYIHWGLAGLLFALAMYSYPPMRLQVPLMILTLGIYSLRKMKSSVLLWSVLLLCMALPLIPLVLQILHGGEVQSRFNTISIAAPEFLKMMGKTNSLKDIFEIFVANYQLHLTPDFLVFKGDPSLIHSLGHFGILSWLDLAAFGACLLSLVIIVIKPIRTFGPWYKQGDFLILLLVNIFLGFIPAAVTNSELPNSLRIVGSWPFMCLLTGYFMYYLQSRFWPLGLVAVLAGILFFASLTKVYFGVYQQESKGMFSFWTLDQVKTLKTDEDWQQFMLVYRTQDYHARYFLMRYRGDTCSGSRLKWNNQREFLQALNLY